MPGAEHDKYYLLREEGLVPLTNAQAALQLSAPESSRRGLRSWGSPSTLWWLVRAGTAAGGSAGGSLYLVTDTGVKGWLPTGNDVSAPGYSGAQA
ncbi:hypothetical protein AB0L79_39065 [Streptomyces tendae]|uniref:hypothetical protein n=1 Tax=Streptomyces tendae TaxID=1932 RepID=UPI0034401405